MQNSLDEVFILINEAETLKYKIWAALLAVYIVWGSTYLAIRFAVESYPPWLMAATRFLSAGALLYAWQRLRGAPRPSFAQWRSAAIVGLLLLLGGNGLVVWAEQYVVSGVAALIVGSSPIWMALIDTFRPNAIRPGKWVWLGVLVGFVGIALLIGPSEFAGQHSNLETAGVFALMLAAFFWALGSLYSRNAQLPEAPLLGTGMEMLAGGAALLILGTAAGEWGRVSLATASPRAALGLGYLIIFGSLIGFAAYTWLLRVAPTPLVSTYAYVNPLIAILIGNLLADEPLTPRIIVAALIIVSSVFVINRSRAVRDTIDQASSPAIAEE